MGHGKALGERAGCHARTSGTWCARLVAAMISSAGSPRKSSPRMARQTSNVSGQTWTRASIRVSSTSSSFSSIRPSSASLPISQITMAEMLQGSSPSNAASRPVSSPARAWSRMWVSRLSIPPESGGQDVALDPDLAPQASDQGSGLGADRDELRHRLAVLRDHDALGRHPIEQGKALGLELGGGDRLHAPMLQLVTDCVHFLSPSAALPPDRDR